MVEGSSSSSLKELRDDLAIHISQTNFQVAAIIPEKDWGNVRHSVLLRKIWCTLSTLSTIRGMNLHSGLSTFLIWTATFPQIHLKLFIYLNW